MFYGQREQHASIALEEGVAPSFLGRLKRPKLPKAPKTPKPKKSRFAEPEPGSVQTCPTGTAYGPLPGSDIYGNPQYGCVVTGTNAPTLAQQVRPQIATGYGSGGSVVYGPVPVPQGPAAVPGSAGSWSGGPAVTPWGAVPSPSLPSGGGWTPPPQGSSLFPGGGGHPQCPAGKTFCPPNICCPQGTKCDPHGVCCPLGMDFDPKANACCIVDAGGRCLQAPAGGGAGPIKPPIIVPAGGGGANADFSATFVPGSGDSYDYSGGGQSGLGAFTDSPWLLVAAGLLVWCLVKR